MRKILILILLACSLVAEADKWYIATTGSDTHGKGTLADPWLTLKHACDTVTGANFVGDTIVVGVGTFTETAQINLGVGVSIYGAGATSIITTGAALDPIILLASASEGTDGNQSISYLKIDGDLTALTLIEIYARSNVDIHHCTAIDASYQGIRFHGRSDDLYQQSTIRAVGNSFHDNIVTNCATFDTEHAWDKGRGNFAFGGQTGMLIYNNIITQPDRGTNANGHGIKFCNHGDNDGTKIYDNIIKVPNKKGATGATYGYGFAFEIWTQRGGVEIMRNVIQGCLDIGGYDTNDDEAYGYALKIYENNFSLSALSAYDHNAIHFEQGLHGGIQVYRNRFASYSRPITFSTSATALVQGQEDVTIAYNIFDNVRRAGDGWYGYCFDINMAVATTMDNVRILNNVVYAPEATLYAFIESNDATTTVTNAMIRNNIVCNANQGVRLINGTVTTINVDNNNFYNVSTVTNYTGATVTGDTYNNNITTDPLFVSTSDFHLQPTSPAIDAGIDVSAITGGKDFHGASLYGAAYDIGAFEYGVGRMMILNGTTMPTINYRIPLIDH